MTLTAVVAELHVSVATVSRWYKRYLKHGASFVLAPGGDNRSHHSEQHVDAIPGRILETPLMTIDEIQARLLERGRSPARSTTRNLLQRKGFTRKRITACASEREREDVLGKAADLAGVDGPSGNSCGISFDLC